MAGQKSSTQESSLPGQGECTDDLLTGVPAAPSAEAALPDDFESALEALEGLVGELENGELDLEQSLVKYRRGVELVRVCQQRLARAEQQVKVLEADLLRPLDPDDVRGDA